MNASLLDHLRSLTRLVLIILVWLSVVQVFEATIFDFLLLKSSQETWHRALPWHKRILLLLSRFVYFARKWSSFGHRLRVSNRWSVVWMTTSPTQKHILFLRVDHDFTIQKTNTLDWLMRIVCCCGSCSGRRIGLVSTTASTFMSPRLLKLAFDLILFQIWRWLRCGYLLL